MIASLHTLLFNTQTNQIHHDAAQDAWAGGPSVAARFGGSGGSPINALPGGGDGARHWRQQQQQWRWQRQHGHHHYDGSSGAPRGFRTAPAAFSAAAGGAPPAQSGGGAAKPSAAEPDRSAAAAAAAQAAGAAAGAGAAPGRPHGPSAYEIAAERMSDREILTTLARYLWPRDNPEYKGRIAAAMALLVASKLLTVQVPFFFKHAVDALAIDPAGAAPTALWGVWSLGPVAMLMGYGISRAGAAFCGEMRNIVFAKARDDDGW